MLEKSVCEEMRRSLLRVERGVSILASPPGTVGGKMDFSRTNKPFGAEEGEGKRLISST